MSEKQKWPNQFTFILAAVGTAAGLGNMWRFPMYAYEYGGAAFILAILIANLIIAYPLMMVETIIGQRGQAGPPVAMEKLKKGTGWIQWIAAISILAILIYYVPVMGWGVNYFYESFSGAFLSNPSTYFQEDILHLSEGIYEVNGIVIGVLISVIVSYALIILSLRKGIASMSKVIKFTATAPFVILFILLIRGLTLPGSEEGVKAFFLPDWSQLLSPELWQAAIGQSFFSAAVAMGYFFYSGGRRAKNAEIPKTSLWILGGNILVSILSGLAIFSTIGFMAQEQGVGLDEAAVSGPMLVFSVLPTAISMLPAFKIGFAVLLFITVITLAIDSIFGMFELVTGSFMDLKKKHEKEFRTFVSLTGITFLLGIPICFGSGMYYLDIMDHFITGYMLVIVGMLECTVVAYVVGPEKIRQWINDTNTGLRIGKWFNIFLYILPLILLMLLIITLANEVTSLYGGYPKEMIYLLGIAPIFLIIGVSLVIYFRFQRRKGTS